MSGPKSCGNCGEPTGPGHVCYAGLDAERADGDVLTHPSTAVPGEVHLGPRDECRTCGPMPRAARRTVAQAHGDDLRAELGKVEGRVLTITEVQRIAGGALDPAAVGLALEYVKVKALVEINDRLTELVDETRGARYDQ